MKLEKKRAEIKSWGREFPAILDALALLDLAIEAGWEPQHEWCWEEELCAWGEERGLLPPRHSRGGYATLDVLTAELIR